MVQKDLQPHLHLAEVNKFCILCGNPNRVSRIATYAKNSEQVASNRGLIAINGYTANSDIPISILTTGMGCPSTAIVIEEAVRAGAKTLIRIGSCGALKPGLKVGDVIIPYAAVRDERTSLMLAPVEFPAVASPEVFRQLCTAATKLGISYSQGIVWTADNYYLPNPKIYKKWAQCGANCVEMESSFVFIFGTVKSYLFKEPIMTGTILVVDGNLAEGTQKSEGELGDHSEIFRTGEEKAILTTFRAIEKLARS